MEAGRVIAATCHPDRPHHAKGKCRQCYGIGRYDSKRKGTAPPEDIAPGGRVPDCHPLRKHHAQGKCARCYHAMRRAEAGHVARPPVVEETPDYEFPLAPLLAKAGGQDGPITAEELVYRTDRIVPLGGNRTHLTDVEADRLAAALGWLPGDVWGDLWNTFDGPHLDAPELIDGVYIAYGPCQCFACPVQNTRPV